MGRASKHQRCRRNRRASDPIRVTASGNAQRTDDTAALSAEPTTYKLTGRPAHDGLAQVDCSGRRSGRFWRVAARLRSPSFARPASRFVLSGSIILNSQRVDNSRRLGRLSPRQSGPRMWSSTLQRSPRLGCRTELSKMRGDVITARAEAGPPPGIVHVDCALQHHFFRPISCGNFHVLHVEHFGMSRS